MKHALLCTMEGSGQLKAGLLIGFLFTEVLILRLLQKMACSGVLSCLLSNIRMA
jgi:hypothetical protein